MHSNTQKKQKTSGVRKKRKLARATKAAFARKKRAPRKMRRARRARARKVKAHETQTSVGYSMPDGICPAMSITSLEDKDLCDNAPREKPDALKKTSSPVLIYALVCVPAVVLVQVLAAVNVSTAPVPDWGKDLGYLGIDLSLLALVMSAWFPARMRKAIAITSACAVVIIELLFCVFESASNFG